MTAPETEHNHHIYNHMDTIWTKDEQQRSIGSRTPPPQLKHHKANECTNAESSHLFFSEARNSVNMVLLACAT
eukprot:5808393-Amphidinium_carterae.1